ncbi:heterokaryon incompatibility protein-domain-containing protein [Paraphoma chrysanthemicola]|uniref:Heterokaryon incompatibility protein-domain-containing protein n=1 Tax=Paraphoma chrysanthemicola TaxID=798071 RepID=A0A8K0QRN2_9PLEO|nr:heterokaryon incompatibility protein-domain-containing protein [Paraphoma chrysanthemicola]
MRLLDTTTFELHSREQEYFKSEGYAILSHRWVGAEITFEQISRHSAELRNAGAWQMPTPQLEKIRGACLTARNLGFKWMWIDNCCINKSSTTEESESINSMFKWYRDAQVCITYLSDVEMRSPPLPPRQGGIHTTPPGPPNHTIFKRHDGRTPSEWFSRGWTLQELLAPHDMRFFDMNWNYMGTKTSLAREIQAITRIDATYLTGERDFRQACIAVKMSWLSSRTTTRQEDMTYSMLGLFNTTMSPQYGEGQRAFMRLQHQLLSSTTDESLFAWRMPDPQAGQRLGILPSETDWHDDEWGLLAPCPSWFTDCTNLTTTGGPRIDRPSNIFQPARQGVQIPIMPVPGNTAYQAIWIGAQLTLVGALPAYFLLKHHSKKRIMKGIVRALNVWVQDETGKMGAVAITLRPTDKEHLGPKTVALQKCKRVGASVWGVCYKYPKKDVVVGQGVVVQPEVRYGD